MGAAKLRFAVDRYGDASLYPFCHSYQLPTHMVKNNVIRSGVVRGWTCSCYWMVVMDEHQATNEPIQFTNESNVMHRPHTAFTEPLGAPMYRLKVVGPPRNVESIGARPAGARNCIVFRNTSSYRDRMAHCKGHHWQQQDRE
jgi:hypothetical protein